MCKNWISENHFLHEMWTVRPLLTYTGKFFEQEQDSSAGQKCPRRKIVLVLPFQLTALIAKFIISQLNSTNSQLSPDNQLIMADAPLPEIPDVAGEIDFREVAATREQKLWMVDLIINSTESAASLAKRYHISRDYLNKMVRRKLKGKSIQFKRGRPRLLDENSRVSIDSKIRNLTCTSISELKESIDTEFKATIARRNPIIPADSDDEGVEPKMSRRSKKRYFFLLHPGVFPPPDL